MSPRVCVLGAGIIGLSCAVRLQEVLGHRCLITVVADKFGKETTSAIAAGCFRPQDAAPVSGYTGRRSAVGKDIVLLSYNQYTSILHSEEAEEAGVHKLTGYHIRYPLVGKEPFYATFLEKCRKLSESEILSVFPSLPHGCSGHLLTTLVVSPNKYMPWLAKRFISNCGKSIKRRVESFCEMWDEYDIIVNCTGLSAGQLTGDPSIVPSRGQVMRVDNSSGKHTFAYIDNGTERMPYYIWTPDYTVIGGTKLIGCTDTQVSQKDHDLIIENCSKYFPWLNVVEDRIREEVVGFRPSRPAIRLEEEHICYKGANKWIVHNYGHCAHGIAYSWGSAHVAVELVIDILQRSKL